jgi:hypothetical protein
VSFPLGYSETMKTIVPLLLLLAACCFGQTDSHIIATGDWSEPVRDENGVGASLRGRLLVYDDQVKSAANHARIYLEIQHVFTNGWYPPVEIYCCLDHLAFELKNGHGQLVPGGGVVKWGAVLEPYWATVPCDGTVRIRADEYTLGPSEKPDDLEILTRANHWLISPNATNDFYLTCLFTPATSSPSPLHYVTWRGALRFPPVQLSPKDIFRLSRFKPQLSSETN